MTLLLSSVWRKSFRVELASDCRRPTLRSETSARSSSYYLSARCTVWLEYLLRVGKKNDSGNNFLGVNAASFRSGDEAQRQQIVGVSTGRKHSAASLVDTSAIVFSVAAVAAVVFGRHLRHHLRLPPQLQLYLQLPTSYFPSPAIH